MSLGLYEVGGFQAGGVERAHFYILLPGWVHTLNHIR